MRFTLIQLVTVLSLACVFLGGGLAKLVIWPLQLFSPLSFLVLCINLSDGRPRLARSLPVRVGLAVAVVVLPTLLLATCCALRATMLDPSEKVGMIFPHPVAAFAFCGIVGLVATSWPTAIMFGLVAWLQRRSARRDHDLQSASPEESVGKHP